MTAFGVFALGDAWGKGGGFLWVQEGGEGALFVWARSGGASFDNSLRLAQGGGVDSWL